MIIVDFIDIFLFITGPDKIIAIPLKP